MPRLDIADLLAYASALPTAIRPPRPGLTECHVYGRSGLQLRARPLALPHYTQRRPMGVASPDGGGVAR